MSAEKAVDIINKIYEWPIDSEKISEVYDNFLQLRLFADENTLDFFNSLVKMDTKQKKEYRDRLASMGFELRPDEVSQYIIILTVVMNDSIGV